jgi:hypothetical protein
MVPSCSLTEAGLEYQRSRYARLAPHVRDRALVDNSFTVQFAEGFDRATLDDAVATERECCPFFEIRFDEDRRRLTVTVREPEHEPALEAIAAAFVPA